MEVKKKRKRPSVICWSALKSMILIHASETKHHPFRRVSKKQMLPFAERMVWEHVIKTSVAQSPSKGVTIFPPVAFDD